MGLYGRGSLCHIFIPLPFFVGCNASSWNMRIPPFFILSFSLLGIAISFKKILSIVLGSECRDVLCSCVLLGI